MSTPAPTLRELETLAFKVNAAAAALNAAIIEAYKAGVYTRATVTIYVENKDGKITRASGLVTDDHGLIEEIATDVSFCPYSANAQADWAFVASRAS